MELTCGHQPRGGKWITSLYPDVDAPCRRFCDIECMIHWHEQQRDQMLQYLREEQQAILEDERAGRSSEGENR
jgi:hypothetical protein